jgi:hypothetical protein
MGEDLAGEGGADGDGGAEGYVEWFWLAHLLIL